MRRLRSKFPEVRRRRPTARRALWISAIVIATLSISARAHAQACCSGSGAITPARLAMHEDALVGVGVRAASVIGSYDEGGRYVAAPSGTSELDLEQDLLAAVRVLRRGQAALLPPIVET